MPATRLGRLATDLTVRGTGLGRFLLADAISRAARSEIASFALIVDAKDSPFRLLRRMTDIAALYGAAQNLGG